MQRLVSIVAVLFGLATLVAGARVLAGSDPGYVVHRPLLIYNTAMGVAYVAAGVAIESLRAMTFRTGVWLVLWLALAWLARRKRAGEPR